MSQASVVFSLALRQADGILSEHQKAKKVTFLEIAAARADLVETQAMVLWFTTSRHHQCRPRLK